MTGKKRKGMTDQQIREWRFLKLFELSWQRALVLISAGAVADAFSTWIFMNVPGLGPSTEQNMWLRSTVLQTGSVGLLPFQYASIEAFVAFGGFALIICAMDWLELRSAQFLLLRVPAWFTAMMPMVTAILNCLAVFTFLEFGIKI